MTSRIVIMDFLKYDRKKTKQYLETSGYENFLEINDMTTFSESISTLENISLFILDIACPTEDKGFEVLQSLRSHNSTKNIPIIIVTRLNNPEFRNTALKYNVYDFITKPYVSSRLQNSVNSILKQKNLNYSLQGISNLTITFDEFVTKEIRLVARIKKPLSMLVISIFNLTNEIPKERFGLASKIYAMAVEKSRLSMRSTDTIFFNEGKDIIIVMPATGTEGARLAESRIVNATSEALKVLNINYDDYIFSTYVTFPDDGKNFQALIDKAFGKLREKLMDEKLSTIKPTVRDYANSRYLQFVKPHS